MSREEALAIIKDALIKVFPDFDGEVTEDTDLVGEDIIDSLDSMNLLFEMEEKLGKKLSAIDEDHNDYRVRTLIDVIVVN